MAGLRLHYPVRTLDNRLLLPAGSVLSAETLDVVVRSSKVRLYQTRSLFGHGTVETDLLQFIRQPPYHVIFADEKRNSAVLSLMEKVHLVLPILESLDYFKHRDFYTYRHILIVFALTTLLAQDMVENYQDLMQEITAGLMHDLGKICVSLEILKKSTPVTRTERRLLEHHAPAGFVLLSHYFQDTQNLGTKVARDHHERKDGSGYPLGIMLTDRMVEIVAACDIYDALLSPRPYRQTSYDNRTALEEITGMAQKGTLSWEIVQILVAYNRKSKPHYTECTVSREKRGEPPTDNVYGIIAPEPKSPPVADEQ